MSKTFHIITLGCKLNKYESDCMASVLMDNGYELITEFDRADLYIINSCAVTAESEKKSRQYVTKCLKLNPSAKIIVCGCASQNNVEQFRNKQNVFSVFGNIGKDNILHYVDNSVFEVRDFPESYDNLQNPHNTQTRAYLKVQDGCNNFCSYCLIPYLRGRTRSRALCECVKEGEILATTCKEIVLTGIDLSSYSPSLIELLEGLAHLPCRIRLGSLEVGVVTHDFMERLSKIKNFCPHFHLSLQSGCDSVLRRMNRHYTASEYLEKVQLIRKYFPLANITTDVIVGFAGETEDEFNTTAEFVKTVGFGGVHVFPYSRREGTVASKVYADSVSNKEKNDRVNKLKSIARDCFVNYINLVKGSTCSVLTEDVENGFTVGYTENYIKVYLPKETPKNTIYKVKIVEIFNDGVKGEIYG